MSKMRLTVTLVAGFVVGLAGVALSGCVHRTGTEGSPSSGAMDGPAPAPGTELASAVLAHYRFDGDATDASGRSGDFALKCTEFRDGALYPNWKYGSPGFQAECSTPDLEYSGFSVALRFRLESFDPEGKASPITGGPSYRWFGMHRAHTGDLTITMNNHRFSHVSPSAQTETGQWMVAACGTDLAKRRGVACLNGAEVANIRLPEGFRLGVATSQAKERDKVWTLTYPRNGGFHGLVNELIIYDRMLSAEEFASIPLKP